MSKDRRREERKSRQLEYNRKQKEDIKLGEQSHVRVMRDQRAAEEEERRQQLETQKQLEILEERCRRGECYRTTKRIPADCKYLRAECSNNCTVLYHWECWKKTSHVRGLKSLVYQGSCLNLDCQGGHLTAVEIFDDSKLKKALVKRKIEATVIDPEKAAAESAQLVREAEKVRALAERNNPTAAEEKEAVKPPPEIDEEAVRELTRKRAEAAEYNGLNAKEKRAAKREGKKRFEKQALESKARVAREAEAATVEGVERGRSEEGVGESGEAREDVSGEGHCSGALVAGTEARRGKIFGVCLLNFVATSLVSVVLQVQLASTKPDKKKKKKKKKKQGAVLPLDQFKQVLLAA